MTYHPTNNPTDLPKVRSVADLDRLPWGGNAWWDVPIMSHVDRTAVLSADLPVEVRMAIAARAGELMTGEDCSFRNAEEFNDYCRMASQ